MNIRDTKWKGDIRSTDKRSDLDVNVCRAMLDLSPLDIFIVAEDGSALYINQTACARRGISRRAMLEMKVWEWNHFVNSASWTRRWIALEESETAEFDTVHYDKHGREIPVRINVQMVSFDGVRGALCYVQDISLIKRIEEDASRFGQELGLIFSGSGMSMCSWNPLTDDVKIDSAWVSMFGTWAQDQTMTYQQWEAMIAQDDRREWQSRLTAHLLGHSDAFDMIVRMYTVSGSCLHIHARGKVVGLDRDGNPTSISILHEDISARVRLEAEAKQHVQQIQQNAVELEKAKNLAESSVEHLEAMARKRDLLYATVAHELRTPISSVSLMANEDAPNDWAARQRQVQIICRDLIHTLDDMRRLVHPEANREIGFERFTITELIQAVSTAVSAHTAMTGVRFVIESLLLDSDTERLYVSDLYRIKIVLVNLIKNACIHSQGTEVRFAVEQISRSTQADFIRFSVIDDGVGISETEIEELFQPFKRGASKSDGTGLGLHIAQSWIADVGGRLIYEPQAKGSRFIVELDLQFAHEMANALPSASLESSVSSAKLMSDLIVLMVEDEPMLRMVGQKVLEKLFKRVDLAANGLEALERVEKEAYDLILTDYFMPQMNGLELIKSLKQRAYSGLIVCITAATLGSEIEDLEAAGAHKVFAKPLNKEALKDWVCEKMSAVETVVGESVKDRSANAVDGTLKIDLATGNISADRDWRILNEVLESDQVNAQLLQRTISPEHLQAFKEYARERISCSDYEQSRTIELDLVTLNGHRFKGLVSAEKLKGEQGDYILTSVAKISAQ